MKLLVLAQTPPPHHGQSAMVQLLLEELPRAAPEIEIHHVNLALSRTGPDIGRWQPGKILAAQRIKRTARNVIRQFGCDALYYVPAPGKRIALWRDLMLLRNLRTQVRHLVLHWHASGLGGWLGSQAMGWERRAAQSALGRADLSIALAPSLQADTTALAPRSTVVVPNGIPDPFDPNGPPVRATKSGKDPVRVLFLGGGSAAKGLFATINALEHLPAHVSLTFAGGFADPAADRAFAAARQRFGSRLHHAGFVDDDGRRDLLRQCDVLAFPTQYEHEAFPLVLLEALAADLPIVTTRWRAIPELLPPDFSHFVDASDAPELAARIQHAAAHPPAGVHRAYYRQHYSAVEFGRQMAAALRSLPSSGDQS